MCLLDIHGVTDLMVYLICGVLILLFQCCLVLLQYVCCVCDVFVGVIDVLSCIMLCWLVCVVCCVVMNACVNALW